MWDVVNVVLTGNFIAPNSYIRKRESLRKII